jgi:hypothetical protein
MRIVTLLLKKNKIIFMMLEKIFYGRNRDIEWLMDRLLSDADVHLIESKLFLTNS